jgi:hypothetical protein
MDVYLQGLLIEHSGSCITGLAADKLESDESIYEIGFKLNSS